ncbi:hypothetical protein ACFFX0_14830 [Citricoccus parietis]|uniref:Uncharacterized protein n=1 Tax=Citricoccus parietis TaxID=592307 RepID=A0ABV5G0D9_9MICC
MVSRPRGCTAPTGWSPPSRRPAPPRTHPAPAPRAGRTHSRSPTPAARGARSASGLVCCWVCFRFSGRCRRRRWLPHPRRGRRPGGRRARRCPACPRG